MSGTVNTTKAPLVSVLIPAFNHERFVQRSLDSVLEDPYPQREIVIIDDGSSDRTAARIEQWIAVHGHELAVEYVRQANKGIAATMNELAARAHGEFLKLASSDDYLLPGGLDAQVHYLLEHPAKWAVIGDAIVVDQDDGRLHDSAMRDLYGADKRLYRSAAGIRRAVISQWAIGGPVALIRKKSLERVAGWSEVLCIDDWDFFLRLAARDAIGFLDASVCAYRIHGRNVSRTRNRAMRVGNLLESRNVALRRSELFDAAYRTLLIAQSHYIDAKISFLRRRVGELVRHLAIYLLLRILAGIRLRHADRAVQA